MEIQAVMGPSVIIAALVYAAIAWGIVRLFEIAYLKRDKAV
jgi:hypothetical protein